MRASFILRVLMVNAMRERETRERERERETDGNVFSPSLESFECSSEYASLTRVCRRMDAPNAITDPTA